MVFTGGDPLKRPDLFTLIAKAWRWDFARISGSAPRPLLTTEAVQQFKLSGVERMAIGLDGWERGLSRWFSRITGSFDYAMGALEAAREIGLDTQFRLR